MSQLVPTQPTQLQIPQPSQGKVLDTTSLLIPRAPSVLLQGPPGTGKTHSLSTIMESGLELFYICTEPNGLETLIDVMKKKNIQADKLHYCVIEPYRPGFHNILQMAYKVTQMGFDSLSKLGPTNRDNAQFLTIITQLAAFKDDRTAQMFGDVSKLPPNCAFALDSLSGVNIMAMDLVIGDKVTAHQGEWGVAMNMIDKLLLTLTSNLKCLFVLTAHIEPERDEITGGTKLMSSTLGRKLAPRIPRFFSEVVLTHQEGGKYLWSTNHPQADLKHRTLPQSAKIEPSFKPIIEAYKSRLEFLQNSTPALPSPT